MTNCTNRVDMMTEHVSRAMGILHDTLKNKGDKKVCIGNCGACGLKFQTDCCKSRKMAAYYPGGNPHTRVECSVCKKDCTPVYEVVTPIFVAKSFASSHDMAWFLDVYNQYHDFEIISQTTATSSGFLGLGGSTTYTVTLKNK